jgi:CheY-like chemotaxis protein
MTREVDERKPVTNGAPLKVVAVSDDALRPELLDALTDERDCETIVVESIPRAYSRIREVEPDLVVVFMDIEDVNACQLLSMLEIDRTLRHIPVMTCATEPERRCRPDPAQFLRFSPLPSHCGAL